MYIADALVCILPLLPESTAYTTLSNIALHSLPDPGQEFEFSNGALLSPILVPRVPGSKGSRDVLNHFANFFFETLPEWKITLQNSTSTTPTSDGNEIPFTNLVATRDPPWTDGTGDVSRLVLAAHYDSKSTPVGFIGATDSAASCAMLLHIARSVEQALAKKWEFEQKQAHDKDLNGGTGIQILLFDGEEAFGTWTSTDSLYGARSLAEEWETLAYSPWSEYHSPLSAIQLFVLLDLLGEENPKVPSYFKTTHWAYQRMADVEKRLREQDLLRSSRSQFLPEAHKKDTDLWIGGYIEDDHTPFMMRGVEILHMIPSPYPRTWHTMDDDGDHLHIDTVEDWAKVMLGFAAEWMDLDGWFDVR
ncbi:hypothetical protein M409DRAFT_22385 [Zasmidium cellare ATCC 36951]|uniref:Peptide hydrolase n=1 Tax=Zasmidium cellare ATCC 36951 TaxID=1080233 RepID=A0A6A6CKK9_ZASCE|nr:uncharacterized protein M409DRAFT_22385 [Zasmidium cellare ATCC 36951]KAF2167581.1 hypothetical protein M409DRAFT_22385 [Zasmidium cellare ATCC 36951]